MKLCPFVLPALLDVVCGHGAIVTPRSRNSIDYLVNVRSLPGSPGCASGLSSSAPPLARLFSIAAPAPLCRLPTRRRRSTRRSARTSRATSATTARPPSTTARAGALSLSRRPPLLRSHTHAPPPSMRSPPLAHEERSPRPLSFAAVPHHVHPSLHALWYLLPC